MSNRLAWLLVLACGCFLALTLAHSRGAFAHDPSHAHSDWYNKQEITPEARTRMGVLYKSCCDAGDHFRTRFRLVNDDTKYGTETYEYWKDGKWRVVPADIIQRKPTPDGQPVLFINKHNGQELCFIIDREGI